MSESVEKIRNMLLAHNDGVYLFSARHNIAQIIEFLLGAIAMRDSDIAVLKEAERFYIDRLRSIPDRETGAEEDEIDRLEFEVSMLKQDNRKLKIRDKDCRHYQDSLKAIRKLIEPYTKQSGILFAVHDFTNAALKHKLEEF